MLTVTAGPFSFAGALETEKAPCDDCGSVVPLST
jgi:hypothetical protein